LSTADDWRLRGLVGAFWEEQKIQDETDWLYKTVPSRHHPEDLDGDLRYALLQLQQYRDGRSQQQLLLFRAGYGALLLTRPRVLGVKFGYKC